MSKQIDYKILTANSHEELSREVLAQMRGPEGWQATGGVAVVLVGADYVWSQAIVRVER